MHLTIAWPFLFLEIMDNMSVNPLKCSTVKDLFSTTVSMDSVFRGFIPIFTL